MPDPDQVLRYAPSGPPVENFNGGPYNPGPGARLRLVEFNSVIGDGSVPVPTIATEVTFDGFTGAATARLDLGSPNANLYYRARVTSDFIETSTNTAAEVQMELDTSVDNGATWQAQASNSHHMPDGANSDNGGAGFELTLPKTKGSILGVTPDGVVTNLLLRVRMACTANSAAGVELFSPATPTLAPGVSQGTFHLELEEVL